MHKYVIYASSGLLLTGFGISVIGEAIAAKITEGDWFLVGTLGLIVFNSGICLFGAVSYTHLTLPTNREV